MVGCVVTAVPMTHRSFGVCYKTAWFMQQRIRKMFTAEGQPAPCTDSAEIDDS